MFFKLFKFFLMVVLLLALASPVMAQTPEPETEGDAPAVPATETDAPAVSVPVSIESPDANGGLESLFYFVLLAGVGALGILKAANLAPQWVVDKLEEGYHLYKDLQRATTRVETDSTALPTDPALLVIYLRKHGVDLQTLKSFISE